MIEDTREMINAADPEQCDANLHKNYKNIMTELQNKMELEEGQEEKSGKVKEEQDNCTIHVSRKIQFSVEYMDPDTVCGIGSFKPQWLQKYATARNYLILYSIVGVIQGSYYTYLFGILSTLEKRYAFKSKISGTIMSIDELTPLLLGVLVGYFGGRMHRPRVLAAGMYMSVLCCFISALPYFLFGPSQILLAGSLKNETEAKTEFCDLIPKHENCDDDDRPPTLTAVVCLCIGSLCKGFGNLAYYAVGLSYMDDNTKKKNSPLYFATAETMRLFGPILGFLMSSACLKYYENPVGNPGYGNEDPRWIGAWWLGFILQGMLLAVISFPLMFFPRRLPKQKIRALSNTRGFELQNNTERIMGLVKALKRLIGNPLYMVFNTATIFSIIGGFGFYIMLPKYMEIQFGMSSSSASLFSGPPALIGMQIMGLLGGWVIWKWKLTAKQLLTGQALIEFIWFVGMLCLLIPSCEHFNMASTGVSKSGLNIENECNSGCLCSTKFFSPVCGPDGKTNYFSPCHAGCMMDNVSNNTFLSNCSCLHNYDAEVLGSDADAVVKKGFCVSDGCWGQTMAYITVFPILCALTSFLSVAHIMILLRCVEPQDKSIALGLFEALTCALGFIPYPVIFGALADSACLIWESSCGETGNCWYYDVDRFKYLIHGSSAAFGLVATICYSIICPMSHRVRDLYKDDDELPHDQGPTKDVSSVKK